MKTLLISMLSVTLFASAAGYAQMRVVDGSKDPSQISDNYAYSTMFAMLAMATNETSEHYTKRVLAYAHWIGLGEQDLARFVSCIEQYDVETRALDSKAADFRQGKQLDAKTREALKQLYSVSPSILDKAIRSLNTALSTDGKTKLAEHISLRVKPTVILKYWPAH
jgi:hypothetical protein